MIVVHSTEVSTLYPRVVILSLAKRLKKPPFCHSYTSFCVWPRDHYMPLQRPTTGVCHALLRIPTCRYKGLLQEYVMLCYGFPHKVAPLAMLWFPVQSGPFCTMWFRKFTKKVTKMGHTDGSHPHSTEHDTLPVAYLISKQVIPYRTRGGTCCPRGLLLRFGP
jgi:hypothetical protein